jgi:hypothetical protein
LPDEKAWHPYDNVSQTLDDGDHDGGFYRQPDKLTSQDQGDFLHPERTGDKKAGTSAYHAQAFDDHAFGRAGRMAQRTQNQPNFASAKQPTTKMQKPGRGECAWLLMEPHQFIM